MAFTAEQLIDAIREAESLEALQRMVGPSEQELTQAKERLAKIDELDKLCEWGAVTLASDAILARVRRGRLMNQQTEFENRYY